MLRGWVRNERGYTLTELLVAALVMGTVAAGVTVVYQTTLGQVMLAASTEDAQLGLRVALDRMAADLRMAGSYWAGASGAGSPVTAASGTAVTFMADVDGDTAPGAVETTVTSQPNAMTVVVSGGAAAFNTYAMDSLNDWVHVANGSTREVRLVSSVVGSTLTLTSGLTNTYPAGSVVRAVERVSYTFDAVAGTLTRQVGGTAEVIADNVTALSMTYFDTAGASLGNAPVDPGAIREVQVSLTTRGSGGSRRTMTTGVRLRN